MDPQANGKQHALHAVLNQQVQCTQRLLDCLDSERQALTRRDIDTVERTTADKLQLSQQLEALERQRAQLFAELGFSADHLEQCFDSLPQATLFRRLWRQVRTNLEACRNDNLVNGGILEASRQHVEQALCLLRGQTGNNAVYTPAGDATADLGRRELGKV